MGCAPLVQAGPELEAVRRRLEPVGAEADERMRA
jgi:hypothetical protein